MKKEAYRRRDDAQQLLVGVELALHQPVHHLIPGERTRTSAGTRAGTLGPGPVATSG